MADEAGTAPEDRPFRPDVEGLRAVAVLLVVLYHAGVPHLTGGYVGVDVFFVISGFVITGVLLREKAGTGRTSILNFYGRRCRRILPAATLVIVVTVLLSYAFLGIVGGNQTATDGLWATIFLANFHFAALGTGYLTEFQPPSPLQNFWSLSVEEQFYLVYPTLFLLVGRARMVLSFRSRLAIVLSAAIVISFVLSITQTASTPTVAYFSPFTRAWELALGALVAVGTPWLLRLPSRVAMAITWLGLGLIVLAAVSYNAGTPYPGSAVALPVIGTALVIAGGTMVSRHGAESLLRLWPFRQLGKLSYSLYLWHWPVLILAAEAAGKSSLPLTQNLPWLLVALGLSIITYVTIENPIRHARPLNRNRLLSVGMGVGLIALTLAIVGGVLRVHTATYPSATASSHQMRDTASLATVENLVAAAPRIHSLPSDLNPPLGVASVGWPYGSSCWANATQTSVPPCLFGDVHGTHTMVVVGDSHAQMWFDTINAIATESHWRLWYLAKSACPEPLLPYTKNQFGGEYSSCDSWHKFVINRINQINPDLLLVSEEGRQSPDAGPAYSSAQWTEGLDAFFRSIAAPKAKFVVLGNIPELPQTGPQCIARHTDDLQACSATVAASQTPYHGAEATAVESFGGRYIDPTPWFCSKVCTPVIGDYDVYFDHWHMMGPYALSLTNVLAQALDLPPSQDNFRQSTSGTEKYLHIKMLTPANGAVLTGARWLNAETSDPITVAKVQFLLSGGTLRQSPVATATRTDFGWLAGWNSASVPNGTYHLRSVAYDTVGNVRYSADIDVTVKN